MGPEGQSSFDAVAPRESPYFVQVVPEEPQGTKGSKEVLARWAYQWNGPSEIVRVNLGANVSIETKTAIVKCHSRSRFQPVLSSTARRL
jgi:hypothetical protein